MVFRAENEVEYVPNDGLGVNAGGLRGLRVERAKKHARGWLVASALLSACGWGLPSVAGAAIWSSGDGQTIIARNASGKPMTISLPKPSAVVADGGGGASLRALQRVTIGGAGVDITLQRALTLGNLAKVGRVAAKASGPLVLASLALEGLRYLDGKWEERDEKPVGGEGGTTQCWKWPNGGYNDCTSVSAICSAQFAKQPFREDAKLVQEQVSPTEYVCKSDRWGNGAQMDIIGHALLVDVPTEAEPCEPGYTFDVNAGMCIAWKNATDAGMEREIQKSLQKEPNKAPQVVNAIDAAGKGKDLSDLAGPSQASGPSSLSGGSQTTTTTSPSGQVQTTTTNTTYNLSYTNNITNITATTTTTHPDGSITEETTQLPDSPEDVSPKPEEKQITCGLPDTPPCKIDETGTPDGQSQVSASDSAFNEWKQNSKDAIEQATGKSDSDWGWKINIPVPAASCAPFQFAELGSIDMCPQLAYGRTATSFLWGILALVYCWRRVGETISESV